MEDDSSVRRFVITGAALILYALWVCFDLPMLPVCPLPISYTISGLQTISESERPRDGLFYRAHEVAFWTKFLPSLERTGETASNEKHHQFPNKSTFYGNVRSEDRFVPFWRTTTTSPTSTPSTSTAALETTPNSQPDTTLSASITSSTLLQDRYSTILSVTVAVGCALLILNILIFAGIYHQWDKQKRFRKRLNNHYQSQSIQLSQASRLDSVPAASVQTVNAATLNSAFGTPAIGSHAAADRNRTASYSLGSPGGPLANVGSRVPPPPPPPAPVSSVAAPLSSSNSLDSDLHPTISFRATPGRSSLRHQSSIQQHVPLHMQLPNPPQSQPPAMADTPGTPRGLYSEQEPLLNRSFISPTCPRHGKQAAAAAAAAMEEIQV